MENLKQEIENLVSPYEWSEVHNYNWFYEVYLRDEKNETCTYKINWMEENIKARVEQVIFRFFNK